VNRRLGRLFGSAGIVVVTALAAEVMARIDDVVRMGTPFFSSPAYTNLMMRDSLGIRGRPFAQYQKWRMNSAGFRSPEVSLAPDPHCVRVAVIGASETLGYYESPRKEFPAQLADSLGRTGCYEVLNTAVAGMSLPAAIQLWDGWVSRFRPDVVVIYVPPAFYLADDPPTFAPREARGPDKEGTRFSPRILDRLRDRIEYPAFIQRRRVARGLERAVVGRPATWFFREVPAERLSLYRAHLDSLVSSIMQKGAVPVLVTHAMRFSNPPSAEDLDLLRSWRRFTPRATDDVLLEFERAAAGITVDEASRRGLTVVDVAALMTGHREWFADFTHFDDDGAAVAAGSIARAVKSVRAPVRAPMPARTATTAFARSRPVDYR
jgi:hypothetical protein